MEPSQIRYPAGAETVGHIVIEPVKAPETAEICWTVAASVAAIPSAKPVILLLPRARFPVGAAKLFRGVV